MPLPSESDKELSKNICKRKDAMKAFRANFESQWNEVADRVWPYMANFNISITPGTKRTEKMFDGNAALAAQRHSAIVESFVSPRGQKWHNLVTLDRKLMDDRDTRMWCEDNTKVLFNHRYSPRANFASQISEVYMSLSVFGTGIMYVGEGRKADDPVLWYKSIPLSEIYIGEGRNGTITEAIRVMKKKIRHIAEIWGTEKFTDEMMTILKQDGDKEYCILHVVHPNVEYDPVRFDRNGKKFYSAYVIEGESVVLEESGYDTFPYVVCRSATGPNEVYGRSPAMLALPNIKMLGEMMKTTVKNAQRLADPSLLLYEDGALTEVNTLPGALNFGGLDAEGNQLVKPLQTGAQVDTGLTLIQDQRRFINDVFLVTLFQILVDNPQMTATEVLEKTQEKGALLSPTMGRIQEEGMGALIEREVDVLARREVLTPLPPAMVEAGADYQVEYDTPLTRARDAEEIAGIVKTFQTLAPYAQVNASVWDNFDGDEIAKIAARGNGAPVRIMLPEKEVDRIREARNQAAQSQQQAMMANEMAGALKDVAQAQAAGNA